MRISDWSSDVCSSDLIIREFQPPVFVMENVKGILSSRVGVELIFRTILSDLMDPFEGRRGGSRRSKKGYRLFSLRPGSVADRDSGNAAFDQLEFLVSPELDRKSDV